MKMYEKEWKYMKKNENVWKRMKKYEKEAGDGLLLEKPHF